MTQNTIENFPSCPVCSSDSWTKSYTGAVRVGKGLSKDSEVRKCSTCGLERLSERDCFQEEDYQSAEYRVSLEQGHEVSKHFEEHDELVRFTMEAIWPTSLRNLSVADIGCGPGTFLDHISGVAKDLLAVEPNEIFSKSLKDRGYSWHPSTADAGATRKGELDFVFSNQVIEHVDDPEQFLNDIYDMLKVGGKAMISTPNQQDILMELLPEAFPAFFYRVHHRWYFNGENLRALAEKVGFKCEKIKYIHRYGISNTMHWLKNKKGCGRSNMPPFDDTMDELWASWLNKTGRADNIFILLEKRNPKDV